MIWKGETQRQLIARLRNWHERFAILPTQAETGEWIWLERYHARLCPNCRGGYFWQIRLLNDIPSDTPLRTPSPPPR